jgi:hypothetical protein
MNQNSRPILRVVTGSNPKTVRGDRLVREMRSLVETITISKDSHSGISFENLREPDYQIVNTKQEFLVRKSPSRK